MVRARAIALFSVTCFLSPAVLLAQEAKKPTEDVAQPKDLSPEARKLLPILEPYKSELGPCLALQAETLAAIKAMDSPELKGWEEKSKEGKKKYEKVQRLVVAMNVGTKATNTCFDNLKGKAIPVLKASSPSDEVTAEAWSHWVRTGGAPAPESTPQP